MVEKRPTLCVVAGPNGSGKTTTTVQLLNNEWAADSLSEWRTRSAYFEGYFAILQIFGKCHQGYFVRG